MFGPAVGCAVHSAEAPADLLSTLTASRRINYDFFLSVRSSGLSSLVLIRIPCFSNSLPTALASRPAREHRVARGAKKRGPWLSEIRRDLEFSVRTSCPEKIK